MASKHFGRTSYLWRFVVKALIVSGLSMGVICTLPVLKITKKPFLLSGGALQDEVNVRVRAAVGGL